MDLQRIVAAWNALTPRLRLAALGGIAAVAMAGVAMVVSGGRSCGERADVEARVAEITSAMQADAASGKITVEELASRVKKVNAAATQFETAKDLGAYCEALDTLSNEFGAS